MGELDLGIDDLAVFVQVVDSGGFTAAGRVLERSTKQVSRQVRRLEERVGRRLLNRTTRAISLTDPGQRLYGRALRILEEVAAARADLADVDGVLRGRLRVALPTLASAAGLANWLATLRGQHPGIALEVSLVDRPVDLVAEGFDLQIGSAAPSQGSLLLRRLLTVALPLAAHERYLEGRPSLDHPDQLSEHECLRFVSDQPQRVWHLQGPGGATVSVPVGGSLQSGNSEVLFSALLAGLGVGVCGQGLLDAGGPEGLRRVLPEWHFESLPIYAVMPRANRRSALVEAFLDVMVDGLRAWIGSAGG